MVGPQRTGQWFAFVSVMTVKLMRASAPRLGEIGKIDLVFSPVVRRIAEVGECVQIDKLDTAVGAVH